MSIVAVAFSLPTVLIVLRRRLAASGLGPRCSHAIHIKPPTIVLISIYIYKQDDSVYTLATNGLVQLICVLSDPSMARRIVAQDLSQLKVNNRPIE